MRRCSPNVVPVLPPTGAAGVGSLNPTPGALMLTMTICAGPAKLVCAERPAIANAKTISVSFVNAVLICIDLLFRRNIFNKTQKISALFESEDAHGFPTAVSRWASQKHAAISTCQIDDGATGLTLRFRQVFRTACEL